MSEAELVQNAKEGSQRAFKKLFDLNVSRLFRFMSQFSNRNDVVEDWVQRAFIKAFKNILSFNQQSKFSTWLFQIAINEMRTDKRKSEENKFVDIEDACFDKIISSENNFEWQIDMKWLLDGLDTHRKEIFLLHEVEGYSHTEIAGILNISEPNSRIILFRTRQYLKEKWENQRGANVKS